MKSTTDQSAIDLWEAWVDIECTDALGRSTLYVLGDIFIGNSRTEPVLLKKEVQGAEPGHLYLDIIPCISAVKGRTAEVRYSETLDSIYQYNVISICCSEEVIAEINFIEIFH